MLYVFVIVFLSLLLLLLHFFFLRVVQFVSGCVFVLVCLSRKPLQHSRLYVLFHFCVKTARKIFFFYSESILFIFRAICHQLNGIEFGNFAGFSHRNIPFLRALIRPNWTKKKKKLVNFNFVVDIVLYEWAYKFFFSHWIPEITDCVKKI